MPNIKVRTAVSGAVARVSGAAQCSLKELQLKHEALQLYGKPFLLLFNPRKLIIDTF